MYVHRTYKNGERAKPPDLLRFYARGADCGRSSVKIGAGGFELGEELAGRPELSISRVLQAMPNAFPGIAARHYPVASRSLA